MKNTRRILIILITIISTINLDAQLLLTEYQSYKIEDDKILLRWEPRSGDEWKASQSVGYSIRKYKISSSTGAESFIGSEVIKPAPIDNWYRYEANMADNLRDFASGARSLIYPEAEGNGNQFDNLFELDGDKSKGNKITLGFLLYASSFDFEISKLTGLASEMKFEKGFSYRFEIQTGNSELISISVDPENYEEPKVPKLMPEWGENVVVVNWDGAQHQGDFLGYMISKSEDGVNYETQNKTPRMGNLGLLADTSALLQLNHTDSLTDNYKTYWYKVEGFDYFGKNSTKNQIVSGQGYETMKISPIIEYANQTDDNFAHLKWFMPPEMNVLVDRYRITRSDNDEGPYKIVVDSIENSIMEYKVPMEHTQNHFRVEAVPKRGKPVGSIPVFIMGQDTIPPAVPEIIGAYIDSVGVIELIWKANTEEDLWGYRIFKSNFNEQEYSLANKMITLDTIFRDTVDINFNTENVFYKIYATDTRDNKSAFTLPVKVEKPDVFPPGMAGLSKIEQRNDSILMVWHPSASDDVVNHHIYRRAINIENSWTLAGILDSTHIGSPFVQTGLNYNVPYAYTIIAYDDVGLKSKAAQPINITLKRQKEKFDPITSVNYVYDEAKKEIQLSWDLKEPRRIDHILVYRGTTKNKLGKYKLLKGDAKDLIDMATSENTLYYKVKPVYDDQTEDYYSDTVEVKILK